MTVRVRSLLCAACVSPPLPAGVATATNLWGKGRRGEKRGEGGEKGGGRGRKRGGKGKLGEQACSIRFRGIPQVTVSHLQKTERLSRSVSSLRLSGRVLHHAVLVGDGK